MTFLNKLTRIAGATFVATSMLMSAPATAHETVAGKLTIDHAHARPNLPNRPSAGYMKIMNAGDKADRLLAAKSSAFGTIELHTVQHKDGVMKMMPVEGIDVPAGGMAKLAPGGFHLMLFDAAQRFKIGDSFNATLVFEHAGDVLVTFNVEKPKAGAKEMDHSGHGKKKHDHSGHGSGS